jgi:hypothetical protein
VEDWRDEHLLRIFGGYKPENIYNADETGLFLRLPPEIMLNLKGSVHWWKDLHKGRTLLLGCMLIALTKSNLSILGIGKT